MPRSLSLTALHPARCALAALASLVPAAVVATGTFPDSGEVSCLGAAAGACVYRDRDSGLVLAWPTDWPVRRLRLVTETGPAARSRERDALRWVSVEYLPDDPGLPESSLLRLAVLRVTDWIAQSASPLAPAAVEVATTLEHVAVATTTSGHPYPPGSRDAEIYEALQPDPAEVSRIVRFVQP